MFVSGKFRDGYVVFRKICDFFYFLFLRFSSSPQCLYQGSSATGMWFSGRFVIFFFLFLHFSSSPQCLCQGSSATGMWFSGRFIIFSFSLSSPVPPLLRFPVLPFFSPLFLFFFLCFYIFTFFSACIKKNSFVVVLKTVSRLFNKRQRRFFLEYI